MTILPFPFPVVTWDDGEVVLLDQTQLPGRIVWRRCRDIPCLCAGIRQLAVRGAPAIGVAAAYGLAQSWRLGREKTADPHAILEGLQRDRRALAATRPTAVNLFWALDRVAARAEALVASGANAADIGTAILAEAQAILDEDIAMCRDLGMHGQALLADFSTVLTHCNAGGLATGGYGTAVGVIYAAREMGKTIRVFADETRPRSTR